MNGRRAALPRHEFRVGRRELAIFGGAVLLVWALTFVFGVLLGRELAASRSGGGAGGKLALAAPATAPDRAQPAEPAEPAKPAKPAKKVERAVSEEKLSFYKTLTAPTLDVPPPPRLKIEERIVPHEPPAKPVAKAEPPANRPAIPAVAPRPTKPPAERPAPAEHAALSTEPSAGREGSESPGSAAGKAWTVQVSSFRSRGLAEELRSRLASKGFDAYLMSVSTEDGRVRHRVRVGGFSTRAEAERVVGELRTERNLNPFVTTRTR